MSNVSKKKKKGSKYHLIDGHIYINICLFESNSKIFRYYSVECRYLFIYIYRYINYKTMVVYKYM